MPIEDSDEPSPRLLREIPSCVGADSGEISLRHHPTRPEPLMGLFGTSRPESDWVCMAWTRLPLLPFSVCQRLQQRYHRPRLPSKGMWGSAVSTHHQFVAHGIGRLFR